MMLPKIDGVALCRQIRKSSNVPILMVTAKGLIRPRGPASPSEAGPSAVRSL